MLGLTKDALEARRLGIGGSDARRIIEGDWFALWQEKCGLVPGPDLSHVLPVQMGLATEPLNAAWYEAETGNAVTARGEVRISGSHPFMRCTLDGLVHYPGPAPMVWQAKHVSGREGMDVIVPRYLPQVQHEMFVTRCERAILSVFLGTDRYEYAEVERDDFWLADYLDQCADFWRYVESGDEPQQGKPLDPPVYVPATRKVDMTASNAWAEQAGVWIANRAAAKLHEGAAKELKAMMEADVAEAAGHGIVAKRSKAGAVTIKEQK